MGNGDGNVLVRLLSPLLKVVCDSGKGRSVRQITDHWLPRSEVQKALETKEQHKGNLGWVKKRGPAGGGTHLSRLIDLRTKINGFCCCCCSVTKSCPTLRPHELQRARLLCPSRSLWVCSNSYPLSWVCHPTISSSVNLLSCLNLSQHQGLFQWVSSSHQVAKLLELQHQSFQWIFRTVFP